MAYDGRESNQTVTLIGVREMTPSEWASIPDNPVQRNTEEHAKRATHPRTGHLLVSLPEHCKVSMAILPDGRERKLDGHTRSLLWESGRLKPPSKIIADVWFCPTIEAAEKSYNTFDNKGAVETVSDKMYGAFRAEGLEFESPLLKARRFSEAMKIAAEWLGNDNPTKYSSERELLQYWTPELELLDQCKPSRDRFHSGIVASALITFRRFGVDAKKFWEKFASNSGSKNGDKMDAVQALEDRMNDMRLKKQTAGGGNYKLILAATLTAFNSYQSDFWYATPKTGSPIKPLQERALLKWLEKANKKHSGAS